MQEFLSIFMTWQFVLLCFSICAVVFMARKIVEYFILNNPKMPGDSQSAFWRDFVLVIMPIVLGGSFPFVAKSFTFPDVLHDSYSKFMFGLSAGLFGPILYRIIKAFLWKKANIGSDDGMAAPIVVQNPLVNSPNNDQ